MIVTISNVLYHNQFWKFQYFLSVNNMLCKGTKQGMLYHYILLGA